MRKILIVLFLLVPTLTAAAVLNVEFKFAPFTGDPAKADHVETVPGKALIYLNNVPVAEKEVDKREVPVLFDEREIAAPVWVPVESLGAAVRKGKNKIRIEFEPANPETPYRAQLRWATVTDQVSKVEDGPGRLRETNQSGEGVDDRKATGRVVFEREFVADFAKDLPWHHNPAVTSLSPEDKKNLAKLVKERAEAFRPDFAAVYKILESNPNINLQELKKVKCLDQGYAAGLRVVAAAVDQLDFVLTGNPEVLVSSKTGSLYVPADPRAIERIKDENMQMCAGIVFYTLYPPRLVVVRTAAGQWKVAY